MAAERSEKRMERRQARAAARARQRRAAAAFGVPLAATIFTRRWCPTIRARRSRRPRRSRAELRDGLKSKRNVQAAKVVGQDDRRAMPQQGNQPGHLRPQRLSLSRPREGAGRRGARSGTQVLSGRQAFTQTGALWHSGSIRRARHQRKGRPHQPGRQGRQGRPALQLQRAGGRRRSERPGRFRPGQGQRSARGDSQGRRARQEEPDAGAAAATGRFRTKCSDVSARAR